MSSTTTSPDSLPRYTLREELAHALTHGLGAILSVAGLVVLVCYAALHGSTWHVVGCSVYGATLIVLYTASTLYHAIQVPRIQRVLRVVDHAAIYLLIAGTYTPFTLDLRGTLGWSLFGVVWTCALLGIVFKVVSPKRFRGTSVLFYLAMGWMSVIALPTLIERLDTGGLAFLLAGGAAYTGGVGFYAWASLPFHHAIWHVCVLAGSVFHYFCVLLYVVLG